MAKKSQKLAFAPEVVVYTTLRLAGAPKEMIALQAQGEAVEISEENPTPLLMAAFEIVHKISPEAVLRLKTGERVLLFNHQTAPVLRDKDIIGKFSAFGERETKNLSRKFVRELTLNLEEIWREAKNDDFFKTLEKAIKKVQKSVKPAMITTVVGKAPALLFLLTQHGLRGKTGEIWYQENLSSVPEKIT